MLVYKIFFLVFAIFAPIFLLQGYAGNCDAMSQSDPVKFLQDCAGDPANAISPINSWGGVTAITRFVIDMSRKVIAFGALFAIGALVFSGIQYTTAYGEDEKIKKAKTTGIYAIIGLLLLLIAFPLVDIIVTFIYRLGTT